jgi:hypothetical protein
MAADVGIAAALIARDASMEHHATCMQSRGHVRVRVRDGRRKFELAQSRLPSDRKPCSAKGLLVGEEAADAVKRARG